MLGGQDTRVIYRHYATLYFVFVVDESESELGILDLIQVTLPLFQQLGKQRDRRNDNSKRHKEYTPLWLTSHFQPLSL
jgi:hypothetical protein